MKIKRIKEWFQWQWRLHYLRSTRNFYNNKSNTNKWIYMSYYIEVIKEYENVKSEYNLWKLGAISEDNT